jgi:hypothetical protein
VIEPEDWPAHSTDLHHPFGVTPSGFLLCAYCAVSNMDARFSFRVESKLLPGRYTELAAGQQVAFLAAAANGFRIVQHNGSFGLFGKVITMVKGTAVCAEHVYMVGKSI